MLNRLKALEEFVRAELPRLEKRSDIEALQFKTLGRKGELNQIMRGLGALSPEERPVVGQEANRIKGELERLFEEAKKILGTAVQGRGFYRDRLELAGSERFSRPAASHHSDLG